MSKLARSWMPRCLMVWVVAVVMTAAGCGKISTDYGKTKGVSGRRSLNGFGALRTSFEQARFKTRDVSRLTDRVMQCDTIVWTPQILTAVNGNVTRWFERWLARGDRTLVYIVPDSGSEADYWIDAARLAPPDQRLEYRRRAARSVNERMKWRLNRGQQQSNGWFRVTTLVHRRAVGNPRGPGPRKSEPARRIVSFRSNTWWSPLTPTTTRLAPRRPRPSPARPVRRRWGGRQPQRPPPPEHRSSTAAF